MSGQGLSNAKFFPESLLKVDTVFTRRRRGAWEMEGRGWEGEEGEAEEWRTGGISPNSHGLRGKFAAILAGKVRGADITFGKGQLTPGAGGELISGGEAPSKALDDARVRPVGENGNFGRSLIALLIES
ncbi:hypothetical protein KM043_002680 [Ampulex compressa]|nr:hypothetical protein KM043_002680 [Ampulex compressa]